MLDFPRSKKLFIWGTLILGMLCAVPTFLPAKIFDALPSFAQVKVNLGLDLSGGSHILLEADEDEVSKLRLDSMQDQVRAALRRGDPKIDIGDISSKDGKLSFMVRNPSQVDGAVERIRPLTQGAGMTGQRDFNVEVIDSSTIVITPTKAGLDAALDQAMEGAKDVIDRRINEMGTREPTIIRQGDNRIVVQVPGLQDPTALKALLGKTARLEFKMVDTTATPDLMAQGVAPVGAELLDYPEAATSPSMRGIPYIYYPADAKQLPKIAVRRQAMVTGDELSDAQQGFDQQTNAPVVNIRFNSSGGRKFGRVTTDNVGKPFAMVLDNKVLSAPNIREPILGGSAQISGSFTVQDATQLAIALKSGALPVQLTVVEERTVGPDLGADSIRSGILASIIATTAVLVFMLLTYGRFGFYANMAVLINLGVILGVMALLNATLTLPGIAGFVLTIGTAVDANVLINERIREERRRGRSVFQSVEYGYKEASRTIFEANVTHAIAGGIMLVLGSGAVKGFAVVLLIGIATSVFTAVLFTRMLVSNWLKATRPAELHI